MTASSVQVNNYLLCNCIKYAAEKKKKTIDIMSFNAYTWNCPEELAGSTGGILTDLFLRKIAMDTSRLC